MNTKMATKMATKIDTKMDTKITYGKKSHINNQLICIICLIHG
jgi:hypothetical protein